MSIFILNPKNRNEMLETFPKVNVFVTLAAVSEFYLADLRAKWLFSFKRLQTSGLEFPSMFLNSL